mgnify:CR=1 FL=1
MFLNLSMKIYNFLSSFEEIIVIMAINILDKDENNTENSILVFSKIYPPKNQPS